MKRILILCALVGLFATAVDAMASGIYNSFTTNPNQSRFRSFSGADGTDEADDDFTFEIDFLYPDAATTPWDNRLIFWVDLCSTPTFGPSGSQLGVTGGIYVSVEPPTDNALGSPLALNISQSDGVAFTNYTENVLTTATVGYDHAWHRLGVDLEGTSVTVSLDGYPRISTTLTGPRNDGEYFHVMQRSYNTTESAKNIRFDNIRIDNFVIEDFESFADGQTPQPGSPAWMTNNGSFAWSIDGNVNSNYIFTPPPGPNAVRDWMLIQ
jgi:hypothetical protein